MREKKACSNFDDEIHRYSDLEKCQTKCNGVASMLVFGTNDFGEVGCTFTNVVELGGAQLILKGTKKDCECRCIKGAFANGTCELVDNDVYRLYRYT